MRARRRLVLPPPWDERQIRRMSEANFQRFVTNYLDVQRWWWRHSRLNRQAKAGLFDLWCLREREVYIELKKWNGVVSADQQEMHERMRRAGVECYIFYPADRDEFMQVMW